MQFVRGNILNRFLVETDASKIRTKSEFTYPGNVKYIIKIHEHRSDAAYLNHKSTNMPKKNGKTSAKLNKIWHAEIFPLQKLKNSINSICSATFTKAREFHKLFTTFRKQILST